MSPETLAYWRKVILDWADARATTLPGPQQDELLQAIEILKEEKPAPAQSPTAQRFTVVNILSHLNIHDSFNNSLVDIQTVCDYLNLFSEQAFSAQNELQAVQEELARVLYQQNQKPDPTTPRITWEKWGNAPTETKQTTAIPVVASHTRGPWTIRPYSTIDKRIVIEGPGVTVDYDDVDHAEAAANALVIAAAPEMLSALEISNQVLDTILSLYPDNIAARVARDRNNEISNKARGR